MGRPPRLNILGRPFPRLYIILARPSPAARPLAAACDVPFAYAVPEEVLWLVRVKLLFTPCAYGPSLEARPATPRLQVLPTTSIA